uniref:Rab-GAP TBC domain-containing protein n=1 Tax=Trichobilharzia regenti TaxID=157069 RepID=A0AA85K579_TRIRE|nr:unnamed protein product [Trichobilharzia regenti]
MLTSNKIQNNINHIEGEEGVEWRQLENKHMYSSSPLISRRISPEGNTLLSSINPLPLSSPLASPLPSSSSKSAAITKQESFNHQKLYYNKPKQLNLNTSLLNLGWTQSPSCTNSYSREFFCLFDCASSINDEEKTEVLLNSEEKLNSPKRITNIPTNNSVTGDISNAYNLFSRLINHAINGQLRVCRFRSICWRIFLGILPSDVNNWSKQLKTDREYFAKLSYQINPDPHNTTTNNNNSNENHFNNDHPLSSNTTSLWNKYFHGLQIKRCIAKDVDRTFPNVQYFRSQKIRDIMINLLYIYTEHQNISYEQGMHEILAPLLFVLHCDLIAFEHVQEMKLISSDLWNTLNYVLNREYFQADVYTIFAKVMNSIKHWYPQSKVINKSINLNNHGGSNNINNNASNNKEKGIRRLTSVELPNGIQENNINQSSKERRRVSHNNNSGNINADKSNYFQLYYDHNELEDKTTDDVETNRRRSNTDEYYNYHHHQQQQHYQEGEHQKSGFYFDEKEHAKHNCSGYCYVEEIHKQLVLKHHPKLYKYLKHLDIEPKLFGLRWIRLLFGHEFPLQDLLYIWDCIFAINDNLAFVPYMYLSMLLRLAPLLLKYEFAECLTLLMNYPTGIDVTYLVYFALHLYKPQLYYKPPNAYNYYTDDSSNHSNDENHPNNNIPKNIPHSNCNMSHRNSQSSNDGNIKNMNYRDRSSIGRKTNNTNNISHNYKKFNSVLSLPCIRDKIRLKIQNSPMLNRSTSYRETENTNHTTNNTNSSNNDNNINNNGTTVGTIRRSKSFKDYEQSLMLSRGVSITDLLSLQKLSKHFTGNNDNVQLLNNNTTTNNNDDNSSNSSVIESKFHHRKGRTSCSSVSLNHDHYNTNSNDDHMNASLFIEPNVNHDASSNYTDLHLSVPQLTNNTNYSMHYNGYHHNDSKKISNLTTSLSNLFTSYVTTKSTANIHLQASGIKYPSLSSVYNSTGMINMKNINNNNHNDNDSTDSSFMDTTVQPNPQNHLPRSLMDSSSSSLNIEDIQDNKNELNEETHLLIGNCIKSLSMCATHLDMYFNNSSTIQDKNNTYRRTSLQASSLFDFSSSVTETLAPTTTDFQHTCQPYTSYQPRRNSSHPAYYSTRSSLPTSPISLYSMHLYDQALFTDFDHLKYIQNEIKTTLDNLIKFLYNHMDIPQELTDAKLIDTVKQENNIDLSNLLTNPFNEEISITSQNDELQLPRISRTVSLSLSSPASTSPPATATSLTSPTHF